MNAKWIPKGNFLLVSLCWALLTHKPGSLYLADTCRGRFYFGRSSSMFTLTTHLLSQPEECVSMGTTQGIARANKHPNPGQNQLLLPRQRGQPSLDMNPAPTLVFRGRVRQPLHKQLGPGHGQQAEGRARRNSVRRWHGELRLSEAQPGRHHPRWLAGSLTHRRASARPPRSGICP